MERQQQERLWAGSRWKETGYVFTSTIGTPIDDRRIRKEFNTLATAAKLPKQRFHDLRHACILTVRCTGRALKVIFTRPLNQPVAESDLINGVEPVSFRFSGAGNESRTRDLLITSRYLAKNQ
jgi:hypothetical protein